MQAFIEQLFHYSICIVPAFVFALLISAILTEIIPESFFENVLSSKSFIFIIVSSVVGALIPLCTCGMIPLATKLQKKGASWLMVISFLTAGNASSITAILLTLTLGLKITLLRFIVSVIFGILVSYVFVLIFKPEISSFINKASCTESSKVTALPLKIFHEFKGLLFCFGPWVIAAVLIGTIISFYLNPESVIKIAGIENILSPFILSLCGFPFYFCAGSDLPISKVLLEKGASLGSVIAFMTASPGINFTTFLIYQKWLGFKKAIVYLFISVVVCGTMGLIVNLLNIK